MRISSSVVALVASISFLVIFNLIIAIVVVYSKSHVTKSHVVQTAEHQTTPVVAEFPRPFSSSTYDLVNGPPPPPASHNAKLIIFFSLFSSIFSIIVLITIQHALTFYSKKSEAQKPHKFISFLSSIWPFLMIAILYFYVRYGHNYLSTELLAEHEDPYYSYGIRIGPTILLSLIGMLVVKKTTPGLGRLSYTKLILSVLLASLISPLSIYMNVSTPLAVLICFFLVLILSIIISVFFIPTAARPNQAILQPVAPQPGPPLLASNLPQTPGLGGFSRQLFLFIYHFFQFMSNLLTIILNILTYVNGALFRLLGYYNIQ